MILDIDKLPYFFLIIFCTALILFLILSIVYSYTGELKIVSTNCYDYFSNRIDGLTCTEEIRCNTLIPFLEDDRCKDIIKINKEVKND